MFDGLLKSKFYSKCKSDLKMTKTRVEMIKKKRNAMQKYLRKDVADLLKDGLYINAYGRAEGLLLELNRSDCYDYIEQCCIHILNNLSAMNKQRECPEECREAVSSLMFAAARFADLPELRDLRNVFSERYENLVDCYANKEFVEKLKSGMPSKEMKLQLLQDIVAESGLEWNANALENKFYNGPVCEKVFSKDAIDNDHHTLQDNVDGSIQRKDTRGSGYESKIVREFIAPEKKKDYGDMEEIKPEEISARDEIEPSLLKIPHEIPPVKVIEVDTIGRSEKEKESESLRTASKDEIHEDKPLKYGSIPPPYTKFEVNKAKINSKGEYPDEKVEPVKPNNVKPFPKSVRRRQLKPQPGQENAGGTEVDETDVNKERAAQGQRILKFFDEGGGDEKDEEEKIMDRLLQHYSRKKGGPRERLKSDSLLQQPPQLARPDSSKAVKHRSKDGPNRVLSLQAESNGKVESPKRHTRATSFQPEMLNANGRVHPKLPDYDDFLARLASLRGS